MERTVVSPALLQTSYLRNQKATQTNLDNVFPFSSKLGATTNIYLSTAFLYRVCRINSHLTPRDNQVSTDVRTPLNLSAPDLHCSS